MATSSTTAQAMVEAWEGEHGKCSRRISVNRDTKGKKVCHEEKRHYSQRALAKDAGNPGGNYLSVYLRYLNCEAHRVVCFDFDARSPEPGPPHKVHQCTGAHEFATCALFQQLWRDGCLAGRTVSGYHIYAKVTGMPFFKRFTNVCADPDFHVDLITGDHCNVWEPPLRQFTGTMQTYKWSVLEDHFNIEVVADSTVDAYEQSLRVVASLATLCGRPSPFEAESYQPSIERAGDSIAIARLKEAGRALPEIIVDGSTTGGSATDDLLDGDI